MRILSHTSLSARLRSRSWGRAGTAALGQILDAAAGTIGALADYQSFIDVSKFHMGKFGLKIPSLY